MKNYTIVGFQEDTGETITDTEKANSVHQAMRLFAKRRSARNTLAIVDVFEGSLTSAMPTDLMNGTVYADQAMKF